MKDEERNTITCGKHKDLPFSILCVHLMEDPTLEWIRVMQDEESKLYDYMCPACAADIDRMLAETDISKMRIACVNCVDDIRRVFDKNYEETVKSDAKAVQDLPVQRKLSLREPNRDAD